MFQYLQPIMESCKSLELEGGYIGYDSVTGVYQKAWTSYNGVWPHSTTQFPTYIMFSLLF